MKFYRKRLLRRDKNNNNDFLEMRILIITQYYYPENFKSTDIGEELVKRGHHVDALVGIPNYPEGVFYKGYGIFKRRHEIINGVNIYRCFQMPRGHKGTSIGLSLNYLSYAFFCTIWVLLFFAFKKKYDAVFVFQTSPVTQAIPAIVLGKIKKVPVYTWVLDVWPDSVLSFFRNGAPNSIKNILTIITEFVYKHSYRILVSSKGMIPLINRNKDYSDRIIYFPNWCDDMLAMKHKETIELPAGFIIMMAGNIGKGIGPESLIELVSDLSDEPDVHFVLVGGGSEVDYLQSEIKKRKLSNVTMTGKLPFEQMPALYKKADVMLLTLRKTDQLHLKATIPARLQSYMSAGKPVLAMIDGCAKDIVNVSDCGYAVDAGDVAALASYIRNNVLKNKDEFKCKGINSRSFFERYYQKENCICNLEYYLQNGDFDNPPFMTPNV